MRTPLRQRPLSRYQCAAHSCPRLGRRQRANVQPPPQLQKLRAASSDWRRTPAKRRRPSLGLPHRLTTVSTHPRRVSRSRSFSFWTVRLTSHAAAPKSSCSRPEIRKARDLTTLPGFGVTAKDTPLDMTCKWLITLVNMFDRPRLSKA